MTAAPFVYPGLDEARWARAGTDRESGALRAARRTAWIRYASLPLPTAQDEEGRRTDPSRFAFDTVCPVEPRPWVATPVREHPLDSAFDVVLSIEEDGLHLDDRTGVVRAGLVKVGPLDDPAPVGEDADKLDCAHHAFWNAGLSIRVAARAALAGGVLVRGRADRTGALWIPRIAIEAEADSRLLFAQLWESDDAAASMVLGSTKVTASDGALVRGVLLQAMGRRNRFLFSETITAERGASVDWSTLQWGASAARIRLSAAAIGSGASLQLRGLCLADGHQHIDQKTLQDHRAPDTSSNLLFKCIVRNTARSVFQGVIRAHPGAVRIDAFQKNSNLVMDSGARADSLPGLRIDTDDLKCTHGATLGNPDPDVLFYLRSRGLSLPDARALLVEGFAEDVLAALPAPALCEIARRLTGVRATGRDLDFPSRKVS